ncbi:Phospholipase/carboxylesterase [Gautieria morchelliformis]|nr:Phospholipase/carboxylesterase [Gautieria morchelliformis]
MQVYPTPGLSQTSSSWLPWVSLLSKELPNVKWILPQAEIGPITYDQGTEGPRWFDVHALPPGLLEDDRLTAEASKQRIQAIVEDAIEGGTPPNKILLVGFSQGSAMALLSGLTFKHTLGGIAVLAGWLPPRFREAVIAARTRPCPPIFWAHGTADVLIPLEHASEVMQWLHSSLGIKDTGLAYREYPGLGHTVNDDALHDLSTWIASLL